MNAVFVTDCRGQVNDGGVSESSSFAISHLLLALGAILRYHGLVLNLLRRRQMAVSETPGIHGNNPSNYSLPRLSSPHQP